MSEWFPWVTEILLKSAVLTVMIIGLIGLIFPLIPGLVIIWLAALVYGLFAGFTTLGWIMFAIITALMIAGSVVDNILMGTKAHETGSPWWVVLLALIAGFAGNFLVPIIGGVLAALLTLFLLEYARRKDAKLAWKSMKGMLSGWGWAVLVRFIMGMIMIALWMVWAFL